MKSCLFFYLLFISGSVYCQQTKPAHYVNPKWSPDGTLIVFESTLDVKSSIYTIFPNGTNLRKITDSIYDYGQPDWSPDGMRLVYYGKIRPMQLFTNSVTGNAQRELKTPGDAYQPSLSIKDKIAFNSRPAGQTRNGIAIMNADGSKFKIVTDTLYDYAAPKWSPGGNKILFVRSVAIKKAWKNITEEEKKLMKTSREIMLMSPDGSGMVNLTNDTINEWAPTWSKDGRTIYFLSDTDSGQYVCRLKLEERKAEALHKLSGTVFSASISPDEKFITYAAERNGREAIYIWDIEKKSERKVIGN